MFIEKASRHNWPQFGMWSWLNLCNFFTHQLLLRDCLKLVYSVSVLVVMPQQLITLRTFVSTLSFSLFLSIALSLVYICTIDVWMGFYFVTTYPVNQTTVNGPVLPFTAWQKCMHVLVISTVGQSWTRKMLCTAVDIKTHSLSNLVNTHLS